MLDKIKSEKKDDAETTWESVMQVANASTEQLELYRTQTLVKLDISIRALSRYMRTTKNLLIAILVILILIALLI